MKALSSHIWFTLLGATCCAISIAIVLKLVQLDHSAKQIKTAQNHLHEAYLTADELRQSSDDLTRLARTFVVTGDPKYRTMFDRVLAIRNGTVARPENYHRIYWDLVLEANQRPKTDGLTQSLESRLSDLNMPSDVTVWLKEAENLSKQLAVIELEAMDLVSQAKLSGKLELVQQAVQTATGMLHDDIYHQTKAAIMRPVDSFIEALEKTTKRNLEQAEIEHQHNLQAIQSLAWLLGAFILVTMVYALRNVILPFVSVNQVLQKMEHGQFGLHHRFSNSSNPTLRQTTQHLNNYFSCLRKEIEDLKTQVAAFEHEVEVLRQSHTLITKDCQWVANHHREIIAYIQDLIESADAIVETVEEGKVTANLTADVAKMTHQAVSRTTSSMSTIVEQTKSIGEIANKTNMLSLNAAIEAARAGTNGQGFSVVSQEIGKLAKRSSIGSDKIKNLSEQTQIKAQDAQNHIDTMLPLMEDSAAVIQSILITCQEQSRELSKLVTNSEQSKRVRTQLSSNHQKLSEIAQALHERCAVLNAAIERIENGHFLD